MTEWEIQDLLELLTATAKWCLVRESERLTHCRIVPGLTRDRVLTFPPGGDCISLPQSGILRPGVHRWGQDQLTILLTPLLRLVINNATRECSGQYICQVTESRPPFKTEQDAGLLTVLGQQTLVTVKTVRCMSLHNLEVGWLLSPRETPSNQLRL